MFNKNRKKIHKFIVRLLSGWIYTDIVVKNVFLSLKLYIRLASILSSNNISKSAVRDMFPFTRRTHRTQLYVRACIFTYAEVYFF